MRRVAFMVAAVWLPVAGFAQDAVIRIEAKRGAEAATEAASGWGERFGNVVTFPLARGWVGIGLGPLTPAEAEARMAELKAAGEIPADSFVAVPGGGVTLTPVAAAANAPVPDAGEAEGGAVPDEAAVPVPTEPPAPGAHIMLQSQQSQGEAEAALQTWRQTFPAAGLWSMPGGWYAVTLGPMPAATAQAWLEAFKASGDMPRDAFIADAAELRDQIDAGSAPDLPAPGETVEMPPLDEVQRALRWAGRYDGAIDGKSGPQTRDAIAAEVAALRVSPDPGAAMGSLIEKRAEWQQQMGLSVLRDEVTGLSLRAPMDRLQFDRAERALSIYGPRDGSGAALILFSQPGGQQELLDLSGLVTALGWVPQPQRTIEPGHMLLEGANADHIGRAEGWVRDGRAEGFVLIWPAGDGENQARIAADMSDSFSRFAPAGNDAADAGDAPVQP